MDELKFFVDTNVFFYLMIEDKDNTPIAERTMRYALEKGDVYTSTHVIFEFIRTLEYRANRTPGMRKRFVKASEELMKFIEIAKINVLSVTYDDIKTAMKLNAKGLNLGDKLCLSIMRREGIKHIITADKAFDTVEGISRVWLQSVEKRSVQY